MIVPYRILFVFIFILHAYSLSSIAKSSVSESALRKNNDPVHDFYKSYVLSLINNNDCRNIQVYKNDSFLLDFPEAIDSDKGIYMTNATPNTDIIFYNQGNNINQADVSNVIMSSSPKDETKNSYFCVIYAVQSALYSKEKFDALKK